MRSLVTLSGVLSILLLNHIASAGVTGKIMGTVVDRKTGEKLVSANVLIQDLKMGATSNVDGFFAILNVPPGIYKVQASLLGYAASTQTDVRVEIDQTTTLTFRLSEQAVTGEEITVVAERPIVQRDVSNSRANITVVELEKLPVATVSGVVGLQAGIQTTAENQFIIRGGAVDQTAFMVNGQNLRDARDNSPFTGIALTSIEDIQIQTGGWNAEYGNIRSGLVNVVTKEGSKSDYAFSLVGRFRPANEKHFGMSPYDVNSYWLRPYLDPDVCWTGTSNGAWDEYMQHQYPKFDGWNNISRNSVRNDDPNDDLTPEAARQLFLFQHRKQGAIAKPDFDVDMSFGGPVPFISEIGGKLRFFASYRQSRSMYLIPLTEDAYRDYTGQVKITSDIGDGMKLTVQGLIGKSTGSNDNNLGEPGLLTSTGSVVDILEGSLKSYQDALIFGSGYLVPSTIRRNMVGAKFTHVINSRTFYDVSLHRFESRYDTNPDRLRDTSRIYRFGNVFFTDEAPFGVPFFFSGTAGASGIGSGMNMSQGWAGSRDTSRVASYTLKFDLKSQLDQYNEAQAGFEFVYTDNAVNYGRIDPRLHDNDIFNNWHTFPKQASLYVQDKIEFEGMIANLGVRLEYSHSGGNWFDFANPYDERLGERELRLDSLLIQPTKKLFTVSPRVGVAFPITVDSKLFFNYGHFRSLPTPEDLFLIRRSGQSLTIDRLANPNNPFPKTVSYELGYEHNLWDQFLLRVAGYYKDVTQENPPSISDFPQYVSDEGMKYRVSSANTYRDIRGFEIALNKNRGNWIQGFLNYTYDVRARGYFGYGEYNERKSAQRNYLKTSTYQYQSKPTPQPYARANIDIFTPEQYGPEWAGLYPLGDWRVNLVGSWSSGTYFKWAGGSGASVEDNNVQWVDSWNVNMRLSKSIRMGNATVQFFADVSNLFNFKRMGYDDGFSTQWADFDGYMKSLHLPADIAGDQSSSRFGYYNFPGDDRPGHTRKEGVPFTPMVSVQSLSSVSLPAPSAIYFDRATGLYSQYANGTWSEVPQGRLQQVLDDKAYIDMPNLEYFAFLNPRNIFYGIRFSWDF